MRSPLAFLQRRPQTGWPLAVELALALALKVLVLWLLWHTFFSAPPTHHMRLPTPRVEQHLLTLNTPLTSGMHHDLR